MREGAASTQDQREALIEAFTCEMLAIRHERQLKRLTDSPIEALSLDESYEVQARVLAVRVAGGEQIVGWKVGCTSPAIQQSLASRSLSAEG